MKKIKEIVLNVGTTADQYPGTQTMNYNGYSGQMTVSADSGISRYMQRVNEEEDSEYSEEEEMNEQSILKLRVRNHNGTYLLNETLANLDKEIINESFVGEKIQQIVKVVLMSLLDDVTGETAGLIAALPLLYKNIYELNSTNKQIELMIAQQEPDIEELKKMRKDLIDDITDIVSAIMIALPIPIIDGVGASLVSMLDGFLIGKASGYLSKKFNLLSSNPSFNTALFTP